MAAYDGLAEAAFKALDLETVFDARKKQNEIALKLAQGAPIDANRAREPSKVLFKSGGC